MELKSLISKDKKIEINYPNPEMKGFKVSLRYMSKEMQEDIRKKATVLGFDSRTNSPVEQLDDDLFYKLYVQNALVGWTGLKLAYLKEMAPVEFPAGIDLEMELDFSEENGLMLVKNSTNFDVWLTKTINDVSVFNKTV